MMRRVLGIVAAGVSACSLLTDLTVLQSDADSAPDATRDAVADVDASADAPMGFCATQVDAAFCDDFEDGSTFSNWDEIFPGPPGRLTVDDDASTTRSLAATRPATLAEAQGVCLGKHFPSASSYSVTLSMRLDALDSVGDADLVSIYLVPDPAPYNQYGVVIRASNGQVLLGTHWVSPDAGLVTAFKSLNETFNVWRRVTVEVDLPSAKARVYDAKNVLLADLPLDPVTSQGATVEVGLPYFFPSSGDGGASWENRVDDVVVFTQ